MTEVTKTFAFASDAESFSGVVGGSGVTMAWIGTDGNPAGCLSSALTSASLNRTNYWEWTGTWEDLGVPSGSTVTHARLNSGNYKCANYSRAGSGNTAGPYKIYSNDGTPVQLAQIWAGASVSGTTTWQSISAQADQAIGSGYQASGTTVRIRLYDTQVTSVGAGPNITLLDDQVVLVITYTSSALAISVTDGPTLGESAAAVMANVLAASAADGATVGESANVEIAAVITPAYEITTADDVTVADVPEYYTEHVIVGERVTVELMAASGALAVDVSEGATVGEAAQARTQPGPVSVTDGATVGEAAAAKMANALLMSATDGTTVGEAAAARTQPGPVSVADGATVGESSTVSLAAAGGMTISVTDGATLGEGVTVTSQPGPVSAADGVTLGESTTVSLVAVGGMTISVTDSATLGESVTVTSQPGPVNVTDGVTVGEAAAAKLASALQIGVADGITTGESAAVYLSAESTLYASVTDGATLGESASAQMANALRISVADGATVGDAPSLAEQLFGLTVSDGLTVGETATATLGALAIGVADGLTVGESWSVAPPGVLISLVGLTLAARGVGLTVEARSAGLTVAARGVGLTVEER